MHYELIGVSISELRVLLLREVRIQRIDGNGNSFNLRIESLVIERPTCSDEYL